MMCVLLRLARVLMMLVVGTELLVEGHALVPPPPPPPPPPPILAPVTSIHPVVDWSMPPRFGLDENGNGLMDLRLTPEYVCPPPEAPPADGPRGSSRIRGPLVPGGHYGSWTLGSGSDRSDLSHQKAPATFRVVLDGSGSRVRRRGDQFHTVPAARYHWSITGSALTQSPMLVEAGTPKVEIRLAEGHYEVALTIILDEGDMRASTGPHPITIKDFLIVSIGDSYSSGEGNPERPRPQRVVHIPPMPRYPNGATQLLATGHPTWADAGPDADMVRTASHIRSHRSTLSWPAQVALAIEQADRRSSVTFVSVAATGARIAHLIDTPHFGDLKDGTSWSFAPMEPQIEQVRQLVGERQIDCLLISIGGNDVGFSHAVTTLVKENWAAYLPAPYGSTNIVEHWPIWKDVQNGLIGIDPSEKEQVKARLKEAFGATLNLDWEDLARTYIAAHPNFGGMGQLPPDLTRLGAVLRLRLPKIHNTYILEYPDPTLRLLQGSPALCDWVLRDIDANPGDDFLGSVASNTSLGINQEEQRAVVDRLLKPLNKHLKEAAAAQGWIYIDVIADAFEGHAYCAKQYTYPPTVGQLDFFRGNTFPGSLPWPTEPGHRWIRTAREAEAIQGPDGKVTAKDGNDLVPGFADWTVARAIATSGTLHPNEFGHQAIMRRCLQMLHLPVPLSETVTLPAQVSSIGANDPDDQIGEPLPLATGTTDAAIVTSTDVDLYKFTINPTDGAVVLEATAARLPDSKLVPLLRLLDSAGIEIARSSGDSTVDALISMEFPPGLAQAVTYYIGVSAQENGHYDVITGYGDTPGGSFGGYRLEIKVFRRGILVAPSVLPLPPPNQ